MKIRQVAARQPSCRVLGVLGIRVYGRSRSSLMHTLLEAASSTSWNEQYSIHKPHIFSRAYEATCRVTVKSSSSPEGTQGLLVAHRPSSAGLHARACQHTCAQDWHHHRTAPKHSSRCSITMRCVIQKRSIIIIIIIAQHQVYYTVVAVAVQCAASYRNTGSVSACGTTPEALTRELDTGTTTLRTRPDPTCHVMQAPHATCHVMQAPHATCHDVMGPSSECRGIMSPS